MTAEPQPLGRRRAVERDSLPNTTAEGPRRRFRIGPDDYRLAEARARERRGSIAGFYHSHPDHPARPSQYDLDHAWPFFSYVIVSVENGVPRDMTSWTLREDRSAFDPEALADAGAADAESSVTLQPSSVND